MVTPPKCRFCHVAEWQHDCPLLRGESAKPAKVAKGTSKRTQSLAALDDEKQRVYTELVTKRNNVTQSEPNNVTPIKRGRGRPKLHRDNAAKQEAYRQRKQQVES